jgi:hypothetical protein
MLKPIGLGFKVVVYRGSSAERIDIEIGLTGEMAGFEKMIVDFVKEVCDIVDTHFLS